MSKFDDQFIEEAWQMWDRDIPMPNTWFCFSATWSKENPSRLTGDSIVAIFCDRGYQEL